MGISCKGSLWDPPGTHHLEHLKPCHREQTSYDTEQEVFWGDWCELKKRSQAGHENDCAKEDTVPPITHQKALFGFLKVATMLSVQER